jgi:hypothetical protein
MLGSGCHDLPGMPFLLAIFAFTFLNVVITAGIFGGG